jgi:predicted peroxiredoxin
VSYKVKIVLDSTICKFGDWEERLYEMFVLAKLSHKNGYDALLVNTETGLFSLGWINKDGKVGILGHASDSALVEWVD